MDVAGQDVDLLGVEQVDPGPRVGVRMVDLRPQLVGRPGRVGGCIDSAWSIFDWMDLSQNAAMFGLASLPGWMVPQPSSTFRKSDWAG
jgi:hypothetical protein